MTAPEQFALKLKAAWLAFTASRARRQTPEYLRAQAVEEEIQAIRKMSPRQLMRYKPRT